MSELMPEMMFGNVSASQSDLTSYKKKFRGCITIFLKHFLSKEYNSHFSFLIRGDRYTDKMEIFLGPLNTVISHCTLIFH